MFLFCSLYMLYLDVNNRMRIFNFQISIIHDKFFQFYNRFASGKWVGYSEFIGGMTRTSEVDPLAKGAASAGTGQPLVHAVV